MIAITIQLEQLKARLRELLAYEQTLRDRDVAILRDRAPETPRPRPVDPDA